MGTARTHPLAPLAAALLLACGAESPTDADRSAVEPGFKSSTDAEWSAPVAVPLRDHPRALRPTLLP
jgi:outer membrane biogenesis lipoprotein LolB